MKIAILADSFPPLNNSAAVQINDLVNEFAKQNFKVTVITPSSEIKKNFLISSVKNKKIVRLNSPKMRGVSYFRRVFAELLMPLSIIYNLNRSSINLSNFDGIVTYAPSIFLGLVAKKIKKKSKCKNYLIIRDIFPKWAVDLGLISKYGLPHLFFKFIEKYLYSTADIIGIQTLANMPYFRKEVACNSKLEVVQNWLSMDKEKKYCSININKTKLRGRTIFVYAGNLGDAQGLEIFIDLACRFSDNRKVAHRFSLSLSCSQKDRYQTSVLSRL